MSKTYENTIAGQIERLSDAKSDLKTEINNIGGSITTETIDQYAEHIREAVSHKLTAIPTQSGTLTYNGSAKSPTWSNYDSSKMTIGGTTSATDAGTYTVTFAPKSGYKWFDGTTAAKNATWTIGKASCYLDVSEDFVTVNSSEPTATVTVTYGGDGTVSVSSSDTNVASASYNSSTKQITITKGSANEGGSVITVSVSGNKNYVDVTREKVAVSIVKYNSVLNKNSWAQISEASTSGAAASLWSVGDTKTITLSGTCLNQSLSGSYNVFILGFNHNKDLETGGATSIHFGGFKTTAGQDIAIGNSYTYPYITSGYSGLSTTKYFNMCGDNTTNGSSSYGTNYLGWKNTFMRHTILGSSNKSWSSVKNSTSADFNAPNDSATSPASNTLMSCLPSDLRNVMRPVTKYTDNVGQATNVVGNVTGVTDYLPLLAEFEVQGASSYANSYEQNKQVQYDYYKNGNSKVKQLQNKASAALWWLRSPYCNGSGAFCLVDTDGSAYNYSATLSFGVSPLFII